jgi:hypothetical protein
MDDGQRESFRTHVFWSASSSSQLTACRNDQTRTIDSYDSYPYVFLLLVYQHYHYSNHQAFEKSQAWARKEVIFSAACRHHSTLDHYLLDHASLCKTWRYSSTFGCAGRNTFISGCHCGLALETATADAVPFGGMQPSDRHVESSLSKLHSETRRTKQQDEIICNNWNITSYGPSRWSI